MKIWEMLTGTTGCCLLVMFAGLLPAPALWGATPLPAGSLIQHPAHFFDLHRSRVIFLPGQEVRVATGQTLLPRGAPASFGRLAMPFAFPLGGRRWTEVYVNLNGCLTFGAPDGGFPYIATWPDGTMRMRAAQAELAAVRGESYMVAPFWGVNAQEGARVWIKKSKRDVVITWDVARYQSSFEGYQPLGRNVFQARLRATGEVEFRYGEVAERDGIVGVFSGLPPSESKLADGVFDAGSLLHFIAPDRGPATRVYVLNGDIGTMLRQDGDHPAVGLLVAESTGVLTDPIAPAYVRTAGGESHFYLPKLALTVPDRFQWKSEDQSSLDELRLKRSWRFGADLSTTGQRVDGSTYEVFHYPSMWKSRHATFRAIHRSRPIHAELAIAFTDFRIDDIHNHGSSNAALDAEEKRGWLSEDLLSAAGPVYLGPRFAETIVTPERTYKNHAFGVGWMAHEMIHLWGIRVQHTPAIAGGDSHWLPRLETRVVAPVAALFADRPYREASLMGGMSVFPTSNGGFEGANSGGAASGLSALDLWLMGLLGPTEVPAGHEEMRLVGDDNGFVAVRFRDVVAANRPIAPPPRNFRQAVYVLHEDGRPPRPEAMALAGSLERSLLDYYAVATQGRMRVRLAD